MTTLAETRTEQWLTAVDGPLQYLLVFILAAIPLLEILVVVPVGIGLGLDPLLVAVFALAGNLIPIYGIIVAYDRLPPRFRLSEEDETDGGRTARAKRLWGQYGTPGLAIIAPIATGVHLATVIALGLGGRASQTFGWMTASLIGWTALVTVASVLGLSLLSGII